MHFNYSFPEHFWPVLADLCESHDAGQDFRSDAYFALLRNYRRHGWIVLYLFGNSPALCPSFLGGRRVDWLQQFAPGSLYAPHATSLRMSDLGYRNASQAGLERLGEQPRALRPRPHARRSPRRTRSTRSSASRWTASTGS